MNISFLLEFKKKMRIKKKKNLRSVIIQAQRSVQISG